MGELIGITCKERLVWSPAPFYDWQR